MPPVLQPLSIPPNIELGMRTQIICAIMRGDLPISFTWLKNGQELHPDSHLAWSNIDKYTSILSITSLSSVHSGNYSCVAQNPGGRAKQTATLRVKGAVFQPGLTPAVKSELTHKYSQHSSG